MEERGQVGAKKTDRHAVTEWLSRLLMRDVFHVPADPRYYWASEVTFNRTDYAPGKSQTVRVDFLQFMPVNQTAGGIDRGEFVAYEVKSCMADFKSENGHNLFADRNYYVMPRDLYMQLLVEDPHLKQLKPCAPWRSRPGVYCPMHPGSEIERDEYEQSDIARHDNTCLLNPQTGKYDFTRLECVRKAEPNRRRPYSNSEMLFAMLRSAGRDRACYTPGYWHGEAKEGAR